MNKAETSTWQITRTGSYDLLFMPFLSETMDGINMKVRKLQLGNHLIKYAMCACCPLCIACPCSILLRSAMAVRLYKHHSKHTSNSGFD